MTDYTQISILETVAVITPIIRFLIDSFLIAMFYMAFLQSKRKEIPNNLAFIFFGCLFFLLQYGHQRINNNVDFPAPLIGIIAMMCIVFMVALILFKGNYKLHTFLLFCFFAIREISFFISFNLIGLLDMLPVRMLIAAVESETLHIDDFIRYFQILMLVMNVLQIVIYAGVFFVSLRKIMNKFLHKTISLSALSYLLLPCLSGLILAFILRTVLFRPNNYEIPLLLHRELPIISVFITLAGAVLLFSLIASIHLFQNLAKLYADEKERAVLQKQIQDADSIYTEIKGMKHDMKSHLANIRMLVKSDAGENKEAEIEAYLGKLEETVSNFDFVYQTGNSVCDIIIHQKYMECKSNATDFSANFIYPVRLTIDVYDLAVILNNGLENAIEACNKMAETGRYINLLAYAKGEMFFIEIENSFASENILIDSDTGLPQSSKQETGLHGMGLSNIRRCARKYLGDIDYQLSHGESGHIFRLTVMLQSKH